MIRHVLAAYPAAPLLALALAVSACARGHVDPPTPSAVPAAEATAPAPAAALEPTRPFQPAEPEPSPEEVRAIEHPAVRK